MHGHEDLTQAQLDAVTAHKAYLDAVKKDGENSAAAQQALENDRGQRERADRVEYGFLRCERNFRDALIGEDPTDVERCMLKIRQRGSFKPYGAAVSAMPSARKFFTKSTVKRPLIGNSFDIKCHKNATRLLYMV